eukprot:2651875-Rhodomonas_salina.1
MRFGFAVSRALHGVVFGLGERAPAAKSKQFNPRFRYKQTQRHRQIDRLQTSPRSMRACLTRARSTHSSQRMLEDAICLMSSAKDVGDGRRAGGEEGARIWVGRSEGKGTKEQRTRDAARTPFSLEEEGNSAMSSLRRMPKACGGVGHGRFYRNALFSNSSHTTAGTVTLKTTREARAWPDEQRGSRNLNRNETHKTQHWKPELETSVPTRLRNH